MSRALLLLGGAVAFEVGFAVMLKVSQGFTLFWPSVLTSLAYVLSLVFLNLACKHFDISVAYAVWTGSAAAAVAVIGFVVFHERFGTGRLLGLMLVIGGVVVLLGQERPQAAHPREEATLVAPVWDRSLWEPGLDNDQDRLGEVYDTMPRAPSGPVPWYLTLFENPHSPLALPGSVDRFGRDCIHLLLGRGLTRQDEAFVMGFSLGASGGCSRWREALFRFCARRLYQGPYRFSELHCQVFDFAAQAARRVGVAPLHRTVFHLLLHRRLGQLREAFRIDTTKLYLLYDAERVRWPGEARLARPVTCYFRRPKIITRQYSPTMAFPRPVPPQPPSGDESDHQVALDQVVA
jgi:multidrug transporter EmrE-like cation transporter